MANHFFFPFEKKGKFIYDQLNEFEKYQLSYHPERPKYLDYLSLFTDIVECFEGSKIGSNLIQTHRANFLIQDETIPVMLIGQQAGPTSDYKLLRIGSSYWACCACWPWCAKLSRSGLCR